MAQAPLSTQLANVQDYTLVQGWISHHLSSLCAAMYSPGDLPPEACSCHMSLLSDQPMLRHPDKKWLRLARGPLWNSCGHPPQTYEPDTPLFLYNSFLPKWWTYRHYFVLLTFTYTERRKQPTSDFPDDSFIPQLGLLSSVFLRFKCWFRANRSQWNNQKCM